MSLRPLSGFINEKHHKSLRFYFHLPSGIFMRNDKSTSDCNGLPGSFGFLSSSARQQLDVGEAELNRRWGIKIESLLHKTRSSFHSHRKAIKANRKRTLDCDHSRAELADARVRCNYFLEFRQVWQNILQNSPWPPSASSDIIFESSFLTDAFELPCKLPSVLIDRFRALFNIAASSSERRLNN